MVIAGVQSAPPWSAASSPAWLASTAASSADSASLVSATGLDPSMQSSPYSAVFKLPLTAASAMKHVNKCWAYFKGFPFRWGLLVDGHGDSLFDGDVATRRLGVGVA